IQGKRMLTEYEAWVLTKSRMNGCRRLPHWARSSPTQQSCCGLQRPKEEMMIRERFSFAICCALFAMIGVSVAGAADIKFLSALAMRGVMPDVVTQFERASGHKVTVEYATVGAITDQLLKGEAADVTIVSGPQMEELQKQGKITAGSRVEVARVGVG